MSVAQQFIRLVIAKVVDIAKVIIPVLLQLGLPVEIRFAVITAISAVMLIKTAIEFFV